MTITRESAEAVIEAMTAVGIQPASIQYVMEADFGLQVEYTVSACGVYFFAFGGLLCLIE